jgi:transcriptional regulator with XRE-family HTH domain
METKGERIKQLREVAGLTQEEMAMKLNTTKQTISKYEKNIVTNIPSDRIEAIAVLLNSTPEYILGWERVQKNNDIMADIIVRMRTDEVFFDVVQTLNNLDKDQLAGVMQMLNAFTK